MKYTVVGIDIAKSVFQVHYVDEGSGKTVSKQLRRGAFVEYFANRPACLVPVPNEPDIDPEPFAQLQCCGVQLFTAEVDEQHDQPPDEGLLARDLKN